MKKDSKDLIKRIEVSDDEDKDYVEYTVIHKDGSKGLADLRIMELGEGHHMAYQLKGEGLPNGTKIAEMFFYPHSETSSRRTGAASRVLDYIVKDARKRDVKVIFCEPHGSAIRGFCQARGLKDTDIDHCYLVI